MINAIERKRHMKKIAALCLLFACAITMVACIDERPRFLFWHYANEYHISKIELVFVDDVAPDDTVAYTAVWETTDKEGIADCTAELCDLPLDKDMLMPKAVRRVREQVYVFKLTYTDGCWELVDAAGRFVVPSAECGPINGQSYWHDGGPAAFRQDAFDALVQKYLSASLPAENAEA